MVMQYASIFLTLSDQKWVGNSAETSFNATVWRMVDAEVRVIGEGPIKSSKQCKG